MSDLKFDPLPPRTKVDTDMPLLEGPPSKPPRGFKPHEAASEELEKFGYPPRPDPASAPKQHAVWLRIANRCPRCVPTRFSQREVTGLNESKNWSGAVLQSTPPDDGAPFDCIIGSWIIPNPHPVLSTNDDEEEDDDDDDDDDDDEEYIDGDYVCYTWVGLDGWTNHDCVRVGVVLFMTVKGGEVTSRSTKAAIMFRGKSEKSKKMTIHVFDDFDVSPGDLVTAWLWAPVGGKTGNGWICNEAANSWASASIKTPKGVTMHGTSAEWILAGKNPDDSAPLFPNYGATVFFHGLAHRNDGNMKSINDAIIVSAQDVTSAAVKDTDGVIVHSAALF